MSWASPTGSLRAVGGRRAGRGAGDSPPPSGAGFAELAGIPALDLGQAEVDVADPDAIASSTMRPISLSDVDPVGQPLQLVPELVELETAVAGATGRPRVAL